MTRVPQELQNPTIEDVRRWFAQLPDDVRVISYPIDARSFDEEGRANTCEGCIMQRFFHAYLETTRDGIGVGRETWYARSRSGEESGNIYLDNDLGELVYANDTLPTMTKGQIIQALNDPLQSDFPVFRVLRKLIQPELDTNED